MTQRKIIKTYKSSLLLLTLAIEDNYTLLDMFTVLAIYKKLDKIIDNMYKEINDIIQYELIENINRNADLIFNITDINKHLHQYQINSIMKNPNTNHTVAFELTRNKTRLKNNLRRVLVDAIEKNEDLSMINRRIKNLVYNKVYGKTKGDAYKTLRTFRTEYTRTRTQAKLDAIQEVEKDGYTVTRHWLYTFEAKKPRPSHLASDGLAENEQGYFIIDGYKTKGPGLFGVASEDINCRCDTEIYVTRPNNN